jgi:hypothetical protein
LITTQAIPIATFASLEALTSKIQGPKRAAVNGLPSRWPDGLGAFFDDLEEAAGGNPYAALDLDYLRDRTERALGSRSTADVRGMGNLSAAALLVPSC